jgi:hypothetical protein
VRLELAVDKDAGLAEEPADKTHRHVVGVIAGSGKGRLRLFMSGIAAGSLAVAVAGVEVWLTFAALMAVR